MMEKAMEESYEFFPHSFGRMLMQLGLSDSRFRRKSDFQAVVSTPKPAACKKSLSESMESVSSLPTGSNSGR